MGLDLTDPRELDWLASGRSGETPSFEESHPEAERAREARESLLSALETELQARESEPRTSDELRTAARGILTALTEDERERIERGVWNRLTESETDGASFVERYWRTVATQLVDYWEETYRGREQGGTEQDSRHQLRP